MKTFPLLILGVLVIFGGIALFVADTKAPVAEPGQQEQQQPPTHVDTSTWETYQNRVLGFSIQYPPQYIAASTHTDFSIIDPREDILTNEFLVIPVHIMFHEQPMTYQGVEYPVYHTAREFRRSGIFKVKGYPDPVSELISINGAEAIHYNPPRPEGISDSSVDDYLFIHNDIVYQVALKANDPYKKEMLQSISF